MKQSGIFWVDREKLCVMILNDGICAHEQAALLGTDGNRLAAAEAEHWQRIANACSG